MLLSPVLLLISGALLAISLAIPKQAYALGFSPVAYLTIACFGTTILLAIAAVLSGNRPHLTGPTLRYGLIAGLLTVALPSGTLFLAIPHVGAGFATLTGALPPIFTYGLALLLGIEAVNGWRAAGVGLGLAGMIVLGWSKLALPDTDITWVAVTLLVPVVVASANLYRARAWPKGATALQLAPVMLAGASLWLGAALLLTHSGGLPPLDLATAGVLGAQIVVMTALYIMYFVLQRYAGMVYFSQIGSVAAVIGSIIAVLWFNETLPHLVIPAGLLLALGIAGLTYGQFQTTRTA